MTQHTPSEDAFEKLWEKAFGKDPIFNAIMDDPSLVAARAFNSQKTAFANWDVIGAVNLHLGAVNAHIVCMYTLLGKLEPLQHTLNSEREVIEVDNTVMARQVSEDSLAKTVGVDLCKLKGKKSVRTQRRVVASLDSARKVVQNTLNALLSTQKSCCKISNSQSSSMNNFKE